MIKYKITNNLINSYLATITNGDGVNVLGKNIPIFFSESTKNNGYSDLIREIYTNEKENNVNDVIDNETIKFNSADLNGDRPNDSLKINFKFFLRKSLYPFHLQCKVWRILWLCFVLASHKLGSLKFLFQMHQLGVLMLLRLH